MGGASENSTPTTSPHNSYPDQRNPANNAQLNYNSFAPATYSPAAQPSPAPNASEAEQSAILKEVSVEDEDKQKADTLKQYLLNIFYLINAGAILCTFLFFPLYVELTLCSMGACWSWIPMVLLYQLCGFLCRVYSIRC